MFENYKTRISFALFPRQGELNENGELPAAVARMGDVMLNFGGQYYTGWAKIDAQAGTAIFRPEIEGPDGNQFGVDGLAASAPVVGIGGTPTAFRLCDAKMSQIVSAVASEEFSDALVRGR